MGVVVTVSRQLGSQGSYMAAEAASLLEFRYLDREILQHAAAEAGFPDEQMIEALAYQEQAPGFVARVLDALGRMSPVPVMPSATLREGQVYAEILNADLAEELVAERERAAAAERYRQLVSQVIQRYADAGGVIVAGRGGQVILRRRRNALHVRVYASMSTRVRTLMGREGVSREEAEARIQRSDRERARYLQRFFGVAWDDPSLYNLSINSDEVPVSMGAQIIAEAARWLARSVGG
ncbi:MAG: cytidylate kinase-like family protein [Anaerolineae bacterium]|jgi:cytidylate kinase|nr:cytidylate kinase-like family protein [Anaerolineae bacterium]